MKKDGKICKLEEILEVEPGSLKQNIELNSLDEWDSITKLSLIIFMDEEYGKTITGDDIKKLKTIEDILKIML